MAEIDYNLLAKQMLLQQKEEDNLIKYQLDTQKDIEKFKHDLLGFIYSREKKAYVRDLNKRATCNEKGANAIATFLNMHINRIVSLSDYEDDDEIMRNTFYDIKNFVYFLSFNKEEFGFKDYPSISLTLNTIDKIITATMKKAREAGERDSLRKSFVHSESTQRSYIDPQPKPQNKLFGGLFK